MNSPDNTLANTLIFGPLTALLSSMLLYAFLNFFYGEITPSTLEALNILVFVVAALAILSAIPLLIIGVYMKRSSAPDTFARLIQDSDNAFEGLEHEGQYNDFIVKVVNLENFIDTLDYSGFTQHELDQAQKQLNSIAKDYQYLELTLHDAYILYELQAKIHLLNSEFSKAADFLSDAVYNRGTTYPRVETLIGRLPPGYGANIRGDLNDDLLTPAERRKFLIGLDGWLAVFMLGLIAGSLLSLIELFSPQLSTLEISDLNDYQSGLGDTLQTLTAIESSMVLIYIALSIATLALLFRRKKLARAFAISTLLFLAIYGLLDLIVATLIFDSSGLSQYPDVQTQINEYAVDVGRSLASALIWIPYFLLSKRVEATLTKD